MTTHPGSDWPDDDSALALAGAFDSGATTPAEAVGFYLERIGELSELLGAFVTVTADSARSEAAEATRRLQRHEPLSRLDGIPTAIKDLALTEGVVTRFGSAAMGDFIPPFSDEPVRRIKAAGLISLGKTNTPEFGLPCYTEPDVAPPARTPYDLTRSAGGSSGGAAAAVAGRLVPVALGSDGGGSIRIPASVCGLVGFKPSRGLVSRAPVYGDISGLSAAGPLASTVRDSAAFLDIIAGPTPTDALWAPATRDGATLLDWCGRDPGSLRVARFSAPVIAGVEVDPEVLTAYEDATALLTRLGHDVEDIDLTIDEATVSVFETVWAVSAAMWLVDPAREHLLRPLTRWLRERGASTTGAGFGQSLVAMAQASARLLGRLAPYDVVLTPTLAQLPAPVGGIRNDDDPAADFEAQKAFTPFTAVWNITGMPAVSLPSGWSEAGLPIGTMLAARPGQDHLLYALAAQVEAAIEGQRRRPPGLLSRGTESAPGGPRGNDEDRGSGAQQAIR
ncbi:MAG: amidase [Nocardioidaceae bacterium]|nr:amidase [Nocardioidaceae bacterium]